MDQATITNQAKIAPTVRAALALWNEIERARNERDAADALVRRLTETLELLIEGLPINEQKEYRRRIEEIRRTTQEPDARGGEIYSNVIQLFKTSGARKWTIPEIQYALTERGIASDPKVIKSIYNTVNYFAKTGRLQRLGRGQYFFRDTGAGLLTDDIPDDGTVRRSENDD